MLYLLNQEMKSTEVWQELQITKIRLRHRHTSLYNFWLNFLNFLILSGRRILPINFRHWLWVHIGGKLYQ